nr:MAG TPA: tail protein [Caudoviricetes sp.]
MRDISDRFKNEQNNDNRNYLKYADITLTDGTVINLTNADFWSNGMKFEDSVSDDNTFNIGSANINTLNLSINNFDGKYTDYDFTDATVICYVGIELEPEDTSALLDTTGDKILDTTGNEIIVHKNALIEKIRICTMTVIDTPYQNTTIIELECEDNMRKFDRDYSASKLKYPATRKQIIQDACKVCGVTLDTLNFYQDSYQIPARPDDEALTFRQVIAWTCQIGCQYARCDKYGRLTIKWYDTEITDANRAVINSTNGFTPNLDDVVITGVQVTEYLESTSTDEEASSYLYGEEGYVLKISANKLIPQGTGEVVANIIGEKCVGMSFRPFETECLTDIVLEAGDAVLITDRKGNKYKSFLTNVVLQPGSFEQISCNAESAARNSSKTYSLVTQAAVDARKSVWKERTTREQALQEFKDRLDNSTGVYTTVQTQQDGSQIFYLHDKPTLAESKAVWKMTAEAWGVSTDGGQTWNGGMTVDGDTIVRILNAVGVNADWINAGAITVTDTDGSILFSVDMDTKSVYLDGSVQIGGGKSLNQTFANYLQESKDYSDGKLSDYAETVTGSLGELQDQIDGQIETFYYDYEPTLQNKPASDWTNATERKKHIGDLFFNKTTGYAYRFMQDGATWGWTLVQDTDITKAMKAAEDAQDTADHKRRVFVTKPQPPYDIGDLWSQGEGEGGDILTCTVSRAKGASYVQSDWQKLNKYTDDTKAEEALEAASLARNMTMQLDNDYQGIPVDSDGNYTEFPECTTTATVMYGTQDITDNCTYTITASQNIQGSWNKETKTYTVTGLTADSGWVNIKAAYLNNLVVSKQFSLAKQYAGPQGIPGVGIDGKTTYLHIQYAPVQNPTAAQMSKTPNKYIGTYTDFSGVDSTDPSKYTWAKFEGDQGTAGRTYFFQSNADVLLMGADKKITPASLIVDSFYRDGNGEIAQSQKGWWKLEKSTDNGATWATLTVSQTAALDRLSINVNNLSLKAHDMLKVSLYFDQSKTKLADYQTYSVAVDVASLTQEQIVDILSDDGKFKGLYYEKDESGNQTLFISFNAMKGGVISLGGTNNGNGQLKIYDADGNQISRLGYTGYVVLNKNTGNPMVSLNTAGLRLYTDYTDADNYNALMLGKYGLYAQKVQNNVPELWMEGDTSKKWEGYIVRYLNNKVRINTNSLFTDGCELGANFSTDGSATIGKSLSVGGNATVNGTLMFYDLENQAKTSGKVKRQPVASVSADDSQVAYLFSGTGSKHGDAATYRRLGIRAKWGGSGFSTDYLYTTSQVSDIRLKENIENSETDALETVNQMKVRQFDWKERMGGWHQNIGFVADELEEIDPNLALGGGYDENGEMDVKQINSPYLLNYAIKAIQELSAKVDEQEKHIKELERRLQ